MQIEFEGRHLNYDQADITLKQAFVIKAHTGMGLVAWENGIKAVDPAAMQALWWLILAQNGTQANITELDIRPVKLLKAIRAGNAAELTVDPQQGVGTDVEPTPVSPTPISEPSATNT